MQEDDRRAGSDPLVPDGSAVGGAHLTKRGPRITRAWLLLHFGDATPGPGQQEPVKTGRQAWISAQLRKSRAANSQFSVAGYGFAGLPLLDGE